MKSQSTDQEGICPKCGRPLVRRQSVYGEFLGCSGYPKCKYLEREDDIDDDYDEEDDIRDIMRGDK